MVKVVDLAGVAEETVLSMGQDTVDTPTRCADDDCPGRQGFQINKSEAFRRAYQHEYVGCQKYIENALTGLPSQKLYAVTQLET